MNRPKVFVAVIAVVLLIGLTAADTNLGCDVGWVASQQYCFYFNNRDNVTFDEAQIECNTRYADLLRLHNQDMLNFVKKYLPYNPSDGYWTGLNDRIPGLQSGTGTWLWGQDQYANPALIKWNQEPDSNNNERCGAINIQGTFSDELCGKRYAYICEYVLGADGCPPFWLIGTNKCLLVSNFSDPTQLLPWSDANTKCTSMAPPQADGQPVRLMTVDSPDDVNDLAQDTPTWTKTTVLYWTGLNDRQTKGTWQWADGTAFDPSLITWVQEPNNLANRESCGLILTDSTFSDRDCTQSNNYICYKPLITLNSLNDLGCGEWTRAGHKCVYFFDSPQSKWTAARDYCSSVGGSLFSIDTRDDLQYIGMQTRTAKVTWGNYWIGLNDMASHGTWAWSDGTKADPTLLQWNSEPNDFSGSEDCAAMTQDGVFSDLSCTATHAYYVCEKPAATQGTCPPNWVAPTSQTWGNGPKCYLFSKTWVTWQEAQRLCADKSLDGSGFLFGLTSQDEKNWVMQQMAASTQGSQQWWSGYTDAAVEGVWSHYIADQQDPSQIQNFVVWNQEPNNWNGNEHCVSIVYGGRLNDQNCDGQMSFICQKTAGASPSIRAASVLSLAAMLLVAVLGPALLGR